MSGLLKVSRTLVEGVAEEQGVKLADGYIPFHAFDPVESIHFTVTPEALAFVLELGLRLAEQTSKDFARAVIAKARMDFADERLHLYFEGVKLI